MAKNDDRPPHCGEPMLPIVYGMPGPELLERDDIAIGGCLISDGMPKYRCRCCGAEAGRIDDIDAHMAGDDR